MVQQKSSGGQGLIIAEGSGKTIAVSYDDIDTPILAAAPEMYETIQRLMEQVTETGTVNVPEGIRAIALLARIDGGEK